MEPDTMRFRDFESLVALHGTDPALWPTPSLAERADVREWLRRERELDAALGGELPPLSANFGDRVVSNLPRERSRRQGGARHEAPGGVGPPPPKALKTLRLSRGVFVCGVGVA